MAAWNDVDDKCLDEADFQDVRKEIPEMAGMWQGLASGLGLSPSGIREIDLAQRGDPTTCLDGVIEKWLNQNYNWEKFGEPSWGRLVAAVADGGKNTALAKRIALKHKKTTSNQTNSGTTSEMLKQGGTVGMKTLQNDLSKVAHKWYQIGLQLGVDSHDLDKMRNDENGAQTCLTRTLTHWLANNPNASKKDLVEMLGSNAVGEYQLARRLQGNREIPSDIKEVHLSILVTFLDPVASKWEDIGIQLDVSSRKLDALKTATGNADDCLKKMLNKVDALDPPRTVDDLCKALSCAPVGEKVLAAELRDKYNRNAFSSIPSH